MEKLTIFTPTYNRKKKLLLGYEALCRQTNKDFIWLIIDDGSTDDTEALVHAWKKKDNGFKIEYVYKENGGLHTGYNKAIELMETELCICIDSDDYMPDDGVEFIIKTWTAYGREQKGVAGIVGLDFKLDGTPLGGEFPKTGNAHLYEIRKMHKGDIKIVCKTALLKALPMMPTFGNEKNFNPFYYVLWNIKRMVCLIYYSINFVILHIVLHNIVDYHCHYLIMIQRLILRMPFIMYQVVCFLVSGICYKLHLSHF